jgi:uncharacterized membrane protein YhiD involved in acid resistance
MQRHESKKVWLAVVGMGIGLGLAVSWPGLAQAQQTAATMPALAQVSGATSSSARSSGSSAADDIPPDPLHRTEEQLNDVRNNERQKKIIADTGRLLELATQLKTEVDKSTKDTLSMDVIKKADEIEKLAHSVKEKMKGD